MNNRELTSRWLETFAKDVDSKLIKAHVTAKYNYLWHIFTWGKVSCLEGNDARIAFDALEYTEAILFCDGYSNCINGILCMVK